jgi:hypothetical protein
MDHRDGTLRRKSVSYRVLGWVELLRGVKLALTRSDACEIEAIDNVCVGGALLARALGLGFFWDRWRWRRVLR